MVASRSRSLNHVLLWVVVMFNGLFVWLMLQPAPAPQRFEYRETHMGTEFKIVLYTADEATARRASAAAFQRIAVLDAALSDYDPESELMRLSDRAGGPPVKVSEDLFVILERSLSLAEKTRGAFDPTVGPVVRLWRRARRTRELPSPDLLEKARRKVGYDKVRLDPKGRTVQLADEGMRLDLGGIAKGFASSEGLATLRREGVTQALVAGAGDIAVGDAPPGKDGWIVGVAPLEAPGAEPSRFLRLSNRCVSTSGDAERFVEIGGKRYSHIVDPRTGIGLVGRSSVTVVAPEGATADGLATAGSVLGPEAALPIVESIDGAAALFVAKEDGEERVVESSRWKALPKAGPKPAGATTGGPR